MIVFLNNQELETETGSNVSSFMEKFSDMQKGFALAINNSVIPKAKWSETILTDNDKIVLIKAACGG
jgi:sulfur carrier protein